MYRWKSISLYFVKAVPLVLLHPGSLYFLLVCYLDHGINVSVVLEIYSLARNAIPSKRWNKESSMQRRRVFETVGAVSGILLAGYC